MFSIKMKKETKIRACRVIPSAKEFRFKLDEQAMREGLRELQNHRLAFAENGRAE